MVVSIYSDELASELPRAYLVPSDPDLLKSCRAIRIALLSTPQQQHGTIPSHSRHLKRFIALAHLAKRQIEERCATYKWYESVFFSLQIEMNEQETYQCKD